MRDEARSDSDVRPAVFRSYITGRILRRGFRLKIEGRDRPSARAGPTAGFNPSHPKAAYPNFFQTFNLSIIDFCYNYSRYAFINEALI